MRSAALLIQLRSKTSQVMWILALCLVLCSGANAQFDFPDALFEPLTPRGFRVSIPDVQGVKLFAFHGKLNEEMNGREGGTFSRDIIKAKDGRWTYVDKITMLRPGDTIYYWLYVDYDNGERTLGYTKDDQKYEVKDLIGTTPRSERTTKSPRITTENPDCLHTDTIVNGKRTCKGRIIFQDEFGRINENKWETEIIFAGEPDYEFVLYSNDKNNINTKQNQLIIKPSLVEDKYGRGFVLSSNGLDLGINCTGIPGTQSCTQKPIAYLILPPVLSGKINTKNSFSFRYGTVEIRAKLPKGDWIYPELFLNPKSQDYGGGYESGQIRIAYLAGNRNKSQHLFGGVILGDTEAARTYGLRNIQKDSSWNDEFHVFSVNWKPESITLLVDGEVYGNIYAPPNGFSTEAQNLGLTEAAHRWKEGTKLAPFDREMYLTIGVGVGGHSFPDQDDGDKPWTNGDPKGQKNFYRKQETWNATWNENSRLIVDYVKVFAL